MLVLSRKSGEEIIIGNNIRIKVVGYQGGKVRIGIDAPGDVRVIRSELADQPATRPRRRKRAAAETMFQQAGTLSPLR